MWSIPLGDFKDLPKLAVQLIIKEIVISPIDIKGYGNQPLEQEVHQYGYIVRSFCHDNKCYLFAIRNFAMPQKKFLPDLPELQLYFSIRLRR